MIASWRPYILLRLKNSFYLLLSTIYQLPVTIYRLPSISKYNYKGRKQIREKSVARIMAFVEEKGGVSASLVYPFNRYFDQGEARLQGRGLASSKIKIKKPITPIERWEWPLDPEEQPASATSNHQPDDNRASLNQ